jgi:hypothetical protein
MGYKTVQAAVSILALLNVRLGRWMPNPGSGYIQQSAREDGGHHLGVGAREALREFWGHHPADSDLLYVSDGAHYENLGIVELLRRQCRVIIAVDSSGGRVGAAGALEHSLRLARAELGLEIDIDMSPFMQSETDRNMIRRCWSLGSVTYSDGSRASVLVVRIGTDSQTPPSVVECGRAIRKFPHTSTLNQFYNVQSFQAYVELGRSSMATALRSGEVQAVLGSVPKR